jgi:glutamate-1-semialdehyde 2,1-aminomutase
MNDSFPLYIAGAAALAALLPRIRRRLQLSRAKHRSLAGHSKMSRRVAKLLPFYEFDESGFYAADAAPAEVAARRRSGFEALAALYAQRYARTRALTEDTQSMVSDMQFTGSYRVPFQFSRHVRSHLKAGSFVQASAGVTLTDLDGNVFYDLAGSYGVNVFGYDVYKGCMARGAARVEALGPVLGAYHPVLADNVKRLCAISGMEEVSFHMSGTEAVMQAVRLARYHTGRSHLVRFCGAYHGWWGDVQPGVGNPTAAEHTYTLKDMHADTLRVLRTRRDIACVLINPLQALHPNAGAPGDSSLVDGGRRAGYDRAAYTDWLEQLREVCTERGIVLIFDEVFLGFRLAKGGAQEYFGVRADLVTYGKTLGGGFPVGVVCGPHRLMKRYRDDRPADICFARGTFNSHPHVMGAMNEFLQLLDAPDIDAIYRDADTVWNARADGLNRRLREAGLPVGVANMGSIWTVTYAVPSRYNWMLQYYLRAEGLLLSWVGTGRFIFSLNYSDADFAAVSERFMAAAKKMEADGWWWTPPGASNKRVRRAILREMLTAR